MLKIYAIHPIFNLIPFFPLLFNHLVKFEQAIKLYVYGNFVARHFADS